MGNIVSNTLDKVGDAFGGEGLISSLGSLAGMVMGVPAGAAIGGGLGSLLEGGSIEDAFKTGLGSYAGGNAGGGLASLLGGTGGNSASVMSALSGAPGNDAQKQLMEKLLSGQMKSGSSSNPLQALLGAAGSGDLQGLNMKSGMSPEMYGVMSELAYQQRRPRFENLMSENELRQYETGERRPDYTGTLLPETPRQQMGAPVNRARPQIAQLASGGYIEGPGTGTSDSIPATIYQNGGPVQRAALSDGEFVMTEAAVRGAGGGNPDQGAANMYKMMNSFERRA